LYKEYVLIFQIVHNYGHGTSGVAYSWGTAVEAAKYVDDCLKSSNSKL